MKTALDPRHLKRIKLFKVLFAESFTEKTPKPRGKLAKIKKHLPKIDVLIASAAPEWPINKLNKVDLALLRLAIYEMKIEQKTPPKVVIDEAVELSKVYGSDNTPKFINGVLGSLIKS